MQFILDESNLNGLKPWEANEYNLSNFDEPIEEESLDKKVFDYALSII